MAGYTPLSTWQGIYKTIYNLFFAFYISNTFIAHSVALSWHNSQRLEHRKTGRVLHCKVFFLGVASAHTKSFNLAIDSCCTSMCITTSQFTLLQFPLEMVWQFEYRELEKQFGNSSVIWLERIVHQRLFLSILLTGSYHFLCLCNRIWPQKAMLGIELDRDHPPPMWWGCSEGSCATLPILPLIGVEYLVGSKPLAVIFQNSNTDAEGFLAIRR